MQYKTVGNHIVFRVDAGEELIEQITKLCTKENITFGTVQGIGATNNVTIGLFNAEEKEYYATTFTGDHEITQLLGNITQMNHQVYLHIHMTLGNSQHQCIGGHLNKAIISATFEGVIQKIDEGVERLHDPKVGLNVMRLP